MYVTMGEADKGIALIEQGIAKGGLKRPEDAKLLLGMAQLQSAKNKAKAAQTLRSVQGNDGSADIARLWAAAGRRLNDADGRHAAALRPARWATASGASTPATTGRITTPPTCWSTAAAPPSSTPAPTSRCRACWPRCRRWAWHATRSTG